MCMWSQRIKQHNVQRILHPVKVTRYVKQQKKIWLLSRRGKYQLTETDPRTAEKVKWTDKDPKAELDKWAQKCREGMYIMRRETGDTKSSKWNFWLWMSECLKGEIAKNDKTLKYWASRISPTTSPSGPRPQGLCTGWCLCQEPRLCLTCSLTPSGLCSDVPISGRPSLPILFKRLFSNLRLSLFACFIFLHRMLA